MFTMHAQSQIANEISFGLVFDHISKIDPSFVTFLVTFTYVKINFDQYLQLTSL